MNVKRYSIVIERNLREALTDHLRVMGAIGEDIPEPGSPVTHVEVAA